MARFFATKEKHHILRFTPLLLGIAALFFLAFSAEQMSSGNLTQEKEIVTTALSRSITQCYALEGFYPPDLDYICDHYGFTYNKDHFFIDYQYIGSNLPPDVTVIDRQREN
ncbi:MAG: hypothetical protein PUF81_02970 [Lachnospiraceae bacterium]|nr:hypothetical protein [Agathobacter sp.]MDD6444789.1 hypothetical protein [Lachnospiraceae bacterium]MDY4891921.1 hypothetical protein [Agathobacter sp.]